MVKHQSGKTGRFKVYEGDDYEAFSPHFKLELFNLDFDNVLSRIAVSDIDTSHQEFDDQTSQFMPTSTRFHKLSEEEIQGIQDFPQSKATKKNTKWGIKILTGTY